MQYNARPNEPNNANETDKHPYLPYPYPSAYPRYPDGSAYVAYEPFYSVYNPNLAQANVDSPGQYGYITMCPRTSYDDPGVQHADNSGNQSRDRPTAIVDRPESFIPNDDSLEHPARSDTGAVTGADDTPLPSEINHLDALSSNGTCTTARNVHRGENCSNETQQHGVVTAMNIVDEEDGVTSSSGNSGESEKEKPGKTLDLRVNVPNYTYVDTSDSSESGDSGDSSESTTDNEHLTDAYREDYQAGDTTSNNTSSDSDSDSYLAYSTGLNPYEKLEERPGTSSGIYRADANDVADTYSSSTDDADDHKRDSENGACSEIHEQETNLRSNGKGVTDDEPDESNENNPASDDASSMIPHRLSVIYENMERTDSESSHCQSKRDIDERNGTSFEGADEPTDDAETTMVSVSLPLRFRFFVSEDNEDITTVTVGDSRIREERSRAIGNEYSMKDRDEANDVRVNFHVGNDTSVDFTLVKRQVSSNDAHVASTNAVPHAVDFTLRKDLSSVSLDSQDDSEISCEEQNAEENPRTTEQRAESVSSRDDDDHTVSESMIATQDTSGVDDDNRGETQTSRVVCSNNLENFHLKEEEGMITKPEAGASECFWVQEEAPSLRAVDRNSSTCGTNETSDEYSAIVGSKDDQQDQRRVDPEFCQVNGKRLPCVQDSREDTDDEDSGVTSDLSRMISEVDTDSECASSKNKRYQRTQTHSRLFRLLNDDSVQAACSDYPKPTDSCRKEYLSLPLKSNVFNYDDSYCSNYSSGLTSPEYSPVLEQSWRKFYEPASEGPATSSPSVAVDHAAAACQSEQPTCRSDPYFRAWKSSKSHPSPSPQDHNVVPSLAFKILDSRMPSWAYKVNVLCPRIKSTKNVPRSLLTACPARQPGGTNDPLPAVIPPVPTSCTNANTDYC